MNYVQLKGAQLHLMQYQLSALGAGVDQGPTAIGFVPPGYKFNITAVNLLSQGTADNDATKTTTVLIQNGGNTVVSQEFDDTNTYPAESTAVSMGTPVNTVVTQNGKVFLTVTNASTATSPASIIQVVGYFEKNKNT